MNSNSNLNTSTYSSRLSCYIVYITCISFNYTALISSSTLGRRSFEDNTFNSEGNIFEREQRSKNQTVAGSSSLETIVRKVEPHILLFLYSFLTATDGFEILILEWIRQRLIYFPQTEWKSRKLTLRVQFPEFIKYKFYILSDVSFAFNTSWG